MAPRPALAEDEKLTQMRVRIHPVQKVRLDEEVHKRQEKGQVEWDISKQIRLILDLHFHALDMLHEESQEI